MKASIINFETKLFEGEIASVTMCGVNGEFSIMPGHEAMITRLTPGIVRVRSSAGQMENFELGSAFVQVQNNTLRIIEDVD